MVLLQLIFQLIQIAYLVSLCGADVLVAGHVLYFPEVVRFKPTGDHTASDLLRIDHFSIQLSQLAHYVLHAVGDVLLTDAGQQQWTFFELVFTHVLLQHHYLASLQAEPSFICSLRSPDKQLPFFEPDMPGFQSDDLICSYTLVHQQPKHDFLGKVNVQLDGVLPVQLLHLCFT